ncbi:MAG: hypothetical protein CVV37_02125 [Nitrospira bacterium HGW-Nitrospira-1]|nr:MAG: hypothetical protein CVV37_02125 [Nitrospira bacterium HGW-Nitrospira-1]
MTYTDAVKSGFRLINRNWQLVAVQAVMMIANCIGFFIVVGIPLAIAFIIFGLDLTGLAETRDIMGLLRDPSALLSKYMGLALIVVASFLLYLVIVTTAGLFVFSGSIGVIGSVVIDPSLKFSLKLFFAEAKRTFFPLMRFSLLMGLVFIAIVFLLGLFGGGVAALVQSAKSQDSTLALFLGIFFSLALALIAISLILAAIAVTVYGIAILFFKTEGAARSFRDAVRFLWNRQSAFWLYVMLFFAYLAASFLIMLLTYPFILIPVIGTIISFPLQLASSYIGLSILAAIFIYYYEAEIRKTEIPAESIEPSDSVKATEKSSTATEDISDAGVPPQEDLPPAKGPTEEA